MLIDYRFANFRSFKEMASLSMTAGRQTTLNDNLIREYDLRIVPSAVIYGANMRQSYSYQEHLKVQSVMNWLIWYWISLKKNSLWSVILH